MGSLYVCLFSSGHVKVGRSASPVKRIRQHSDRLACIGVPLVGSYVTDCPDNDEGREQILIQRCAPAANVRHQLEWFYGLSFAEVCQWAHEAAHGEYAASQPDSEASEHDPLEQVVRALNAPDADLLAVSRGSGISYKSVQRIARRHKSDPGYSKVAALHRYLFPASLPTQP